MEQRREADRLLGFMAGGQIYKTSELVGNGFHRSVVSRLVHEGQVQRLGRGLYCLPGHEMTEWHDFAEIAKTVPQAVFGLISALAFHEIGTQAPREAWISLPQAARIPRVSFRLRVSRLKEPYFSSGIEEHIIESVPVRIYSAAKTVADCFRMRNQIGYDIAVEALREGWRKRKFTADELMDFSKIDRVDKVIRPYVEAIIG